MTPAYGAKQRGRDRTTEGTVVKLCEFTFWFVGAKNAVGLMWSSDDRNRPESVGFALSLNNDLIVFENLHIVLCE